MNRNKLEETNYSLAFAVPKQRFFVWLERTLRNSGRPLEGFYLEAEDLACLIPSTHTFDSQAALTVFTDGLKVKLLKRTLGGIGVGRADCPELSSNLFDDFFDLQIKDKVCVAAHNNNQAGPAPLRAEPNRKSSRRDGCLDLVNHSQRLPATATQNMLAKTSKPGKIPTQAGIGVNNSAII